MYRERRFEGQSIRARKSLPVENAEQGVTCNFSSQHVILLRIGSVEAPKGTEMAEARLVLCFQARPKGRPSCAH
jgi:hypothetical protein